MGKVTLEQGHQLDTFLLREDDPKGFIKNLLSNWDAIQAIGRGKIDQATFQTAIKGVVNLFAEEKTDPRWFYPEGWEPTGVLEQLSVLQRFYPGLDGSRVVDFAARITVPEDADGLFVVPKPSSIAAKLGIDNPFGEGYGQLLEASVLDLLANQRTFHNYRAGKLTLDRVRMRQSAADAIWKLEAEQPEGDLLVFAAQTGKKWGGYSPRNACWDIEHKSEFEFPLPAWCVGHIILTNQTRLDSYEILGIDCSGDEYRFRGDVAFQDCLFFDFCDDHQIRFYSRWFGNLNDRYGSASGFSG